MTRLLFWTTTALAGFLLALVLIAPLLDYESALPDVWTLFARDAALRHTCLASAVGLIVTACVFFRVPGRWRPSRKSSDHLPPRGTPMGA